VETILVPQENIAEIEKICQENPNLQQDTR
jgi:hypothetical protein